MKNYIILLCKIIKLAVKINFLAMCAKFAESLGGSTRCALRAAVIFQCRCDVLIIVAGKGRQVELMRIFVGCFNFVIT